MFLKFSWWKNKDNRDSITAIVGAAKVIVPFVVAAIVAIGAYLGLPPGKTSAPAAPSISVNGDGNAVQTGDGTLVVQNGGGTVIIGMTIDQHETILEQREAILRTDLARASDAERRLISLELEAVTGDLADLERSYATAVADLRVLRKRLQGFDGDVPPDRLAAAQQALSGGDRSLADTLFAELETDLGDEVERAARAAFGRGQIAEAEIRWADAARHYSRAAALAPNYLHLYKASVFSRRAGDLTAALMLGEDLITASTDHEGPRRRADALTVYALALSGAGKLSEAERRFREALEIDTDTIGQSHPDHAMRLHNLGSVVRELGRYQEAETLSRRALDISERSAGAGDTFRAEYLTGLANAVFGQGRYDEAEDLYRKAAEIGKTVLGQTHPYYAARLHNLSQVLRSQGRPGEAEELLREVQHIEQEILGETHPEYAMTLVSLGLAVADQGRHAEAEALHRAALEIDRKTIGKAHPRYARHLNNLALSVQALGRITEAEDYYREALEISERALPADHPALRTIRANLDALQEVID